MEELGFVSLSSDAGVFIKRDRNSFIIAIIYVNDAIFCGPDKTFVLAMKEAFMKKWEVRDLGEVTEFLCMQITHDGDKIHLDQSAYLRTVLEHCGMQNAEAAATPFPAGYVLKPSEEQTNPERQSRYQTVIGSLLYLMLGTRPDITFAVTKLAQYAANPSKEHLDEALYICRYLVRTPNYRLTYDCSSGQGLSACTDSDWASDNVTRRSQSGYFAKMAKGLISWTSRVQKTVALSLGARASVLGWYITSTSQGNGQSTWDVPTQSIPGTFRIFPASFPAMSLAWGMVRTFTVFQVT